MLMTEHTSLKNYPLSFAYVRVLQLCNLPECIVIAFLTAGSHTDSGVTQLTLYPLQVMHDSPIHSLIKLGNNTCREIRPSFGKAGCNSSKLISWYNGNSKVSVSNDIFYDSKPLWILISSQKRISKESQWTWQVKSESFSFQHLLTCFSIILSTWFCNFFCFPLPKTQELPKSKNYWTELVLLLMTPNWPKNPLGNHPPHLFFFFSSLSWCSVLCWLFLRISCVDVN